MFQDWEVRDGPQRAFRTEDASPKIPVNGPHRANGNFYTVPLSCPKMLKEMLRMLPNQRGSSHITPNRAKPWTLSFAVEKLKQFIGGAPSQENRKLALKTRTPGWFLIKDI